LALVAVQTSRRPFEFSHTTVSFLPDHSLELLHRFAGFAFEPRGCGDGLPGCAFAATNFFDGRPPLDLAVADCLRRLPVDPGHRLQRFALPLFRCGDGLLGCAFGPTNFFGDRPPLDLAVADCLRRLPIGALVSPLGLLIERERLCNLDSGGHCRADGSRPP
jgi:hypothetical protein